MSDEITAEKAFTDAAIGHQWNGVQLLPWSGSRTIAAQAMGMKAPFFTDEDKKDLEENRPYKGAVRDVITFLWLCCTKNASEQALEDVRAKAWTVQRARNNPAQAYEEAERWGIERNLHKSHSKEFIEGLGVLMAVLEAEMASQFEVRAEGESGNSSEPGKV